MKSIPCKESRHRRQSFHPQIVSFEILERFLGFHPFLVEVLREERKERERGKGLGIESYL